MKWVIRKTASQMRGGFFSYESRFISKLPIHNLILTDADEEARHDRLVEMVENMLAWNKQLAEAKTPQERAVLERQIATTDKAIDQLAYELYGLTDEEIRLVEEETGART